jgi:hypothetical protein
LEGIINFIMMMMKRRHFLTYSFCLVLMAGIVNLFSFVFYTEVRVKSYPVQTEADRFGLKLGRVLSASAVTANSAIEKIKSDRNAFVSINSKKEHSSQASYNVSLTTAERV